MFSIKVSVQGDPGRILDKQTLSFPCPSCGFYNDIFFRQVVLRDTIICRGCHANIRLDDQMDEARKARKKIRAIFRGIEDLFR